jgi:acetyl-CoA carboxylase biotin carboxyl carrier protein
MPPRGKSKTAPALSTSKLASQGDTGDERIVETVRGLAGIIAEHGLSEVIVDTPIATITLRRVIAAAPQVATPPPAPIHFAAPPPVAVSASSHVASEMIAIDDKAHVVTSPFVGTFYRKPNPDSVVYVQLGDRVEKGKALCIIEAMKLMNEIEADVAGTVVAILVEDGAAVEYGQPLFKIST